MTTLQQYQDPFTDMMPSRFSSMLDRFFDDTVTARGQLSTFSPKVDTYETENSYDIEAALPGLKQEDVKVNFEQGVLTIAGERKFEKERKERQYHVVESSYGSFQRAFRLPEATEPGQIEASFDNGVLHVHVPKNKTKVAQHQIPVRSGANGK
ncbi:Hsp20/alpha crystallin family protein [Hymenobacter sp. BT188]|uniref:Hsp20/alpha crystallin family protein n=1 Tax=Hymenobacter sp. BT188 TaxID=2763504 RepID=UPI001650EF78|nr:Hsp20/alpha crystallin family protein [Hymenobacter sp. BT188]MBC6605894.1 Hsp20/alpha crystallin family protein [Hymenobacter sp. BT188]